MDEALTTNKKLFSSYQEMINPPAAICIAKANVLLM